MRKIALLASFAIVLVSCKDRQKDVTMTQPINLNGNVSSTQANAGKANTAFTTSTNTAGLKLNPAHGQPGHRCDLDVGAPLPVANAGNTTAATPQVTRTETPITVQATPATTTTNTTPNTTTTAKSGNLNPAHGQPGHRCDIAVGAPLNSAPAKTSVQQVKAAENVTAIPVNAQPVAPGMNPQHGQPGHRCDIAVGAPLNSAPAPSVQAKDSTKG